MSFDKCTIINITIIIQKIPIATKITLIPWGSKSHPFALKLLAMTYLFLLPQFCLS